MSLRSLEVSDRAELLELVVASRSLHQPWAYPPDREVSVDDLLARAGHDDFFSLAVCRAQDGAIAGVFNLSQIVRGAFQSASIGYYAHERYAGQGYMREGLRRVIAYAFGPLHLHRLEINVQPGNEASTSLAVGAGFRLEGFSPRYLLVGGRWRDHQRFALTADEVDHFG